MIMGQLFNVEDDRLVGRHLITFPCKGLDEGEVWGSVVLVRAQLVGVSF